MNASIDRKNDGTIEMTLTIPWKQVLDAYTHALADYTKNSQIQGFRQGKAPKEMVEKSIGKNKIFEQAIQDIIPSLYQEAVKDNNLKPVMLPQIHLDSAKEKEDW